MSYCLCGPLSSGQDCGFSWKRFAAWGRSRAGGQHMWGCYVDFEFCPGPSGSVLNILSGAPHLEFSAKRCNRSRRQQDLFTSPNGVWFARTAPWALAHTQSHQGPHCAAWLN